MTSRDASDYYMNMARRWFTAGWPEISRLPMTCRRDGQNQWSPCRRRGPKRKIQEQQTGFPDLTTPIEDMFSANDKPWRDLYGPERIPAHTGPWDHWQRRRGAGLCRRTRQRQQATV